MMIESHHEESYSLNTFCVRFLKLSLVSMYMFASVDVQASHKVTWLETRRQVSLSKSLSYEGCFVHMRKHMITVKLISTFFLLHR